MLAKLQFLEPAHWASACIELLEFDTPEREDLLGKQSEHLKRLKDPQTGYCLSLIANLEGRTGIALATSKDPLRAREIVVARCAEHCRQGNLSSLWCIFQGVPISSSELLVLCAVPGTEVGDHTLSLLEQLEIQIVEHRYTDHSGEID